MSLFTFPEDFIFGTATSSYQIEGATGEDGRGPSIWDAFCRAPGAVLDGHTGDVACDHYHRIEQDVALMRELGVGAYRFSIAWPRIIPDGEGEVNPRGLDFYSRLVDALLAAGITPYATMYHWDLPLALEERHGGWRSRTTAEAFGRYAETVVRALGDRVTNWMPLNEMPATIIAGYEAGFHAPGAKEPRGVVNQVQHHCLLAHGLGVRAVREHGTAGSEVGTAHDARVYVPVIETDEHVEATRQAFVNDNGPMLEPMARGTYPAAWLEAMGPDAPKIEPVDMDIISSPCDFIGLNVYRGFFVEAAGSESTHRGMTVAGGGALNAPAPVAMTPSTATRPEDATYDVLPFPESYPRGASEWVLLVPQAVYWGLRHLHQEYGYRKLYITENGTPGKDDTVDGRCIDLDRVEYYRLYLQNAARAVADGLPLAGYFAWSMMDNFEWSHGYHDRFGIHYVDFETLERTPKLSARFYAACIRAKAVL